MRRLAAFVPHAARLRPALAPRPARPCTSSSEAALEAQRRKLFYRCKERGMVETELLLKPFAETHLASMGAAELALFEDFLDEPDPSIYQWLARKAPFPDKYTHAERPLSEQLITFTQHFKTADKSHW